MTDSPTPQREDPFERVTGSGWLGFAGVLILLLGVFKVIEGIWALGNARYRADFNALMYVFSLKGWGWIHIILGIVLIATAIGILGGQEWARGLGIGLAAATAVLQLLYLPYGAAALLNIGLCVLVIYALAVPKSGSVAG